MDLLKRFDYLMNHLNSLEDDVAQNFREVLEEAEEKLSWLSALECAGVDNWEGCDHASDIYHEWNGTEDE